MKMMSTCFSAGEHDRFDPTHYDDRFVALMEYVEQRSPDFVCFQEVLPKFVEKLRALPWVQVPCLLFHWSGYGVSYCDSGIRVMCMTCQLCTRASCDEPDAAGL